jgi:(p)ppGpp synthase/HD superfamily hydrolase
MQKLLEAIYFAADKHNGQLRKDGKTPVITHLLTVALLLSQITKDENIVIAGILHDVLEDTKTTESEIKDIFGPKVLEIVKECTEEDRGKDWEKRWKERKAKTLNKIKTTSRPGALVLTSDTVSNSYELLRNLKITGLRYTKSFHSSIEDKLENDHKKLKELKKYHSNPLLKLTSKNIIETKKVVKSLKTK